jgi:hypothetical protein
MMNKKMPVEMKGKDRYGLSNCHSLDKRWICRLTFHLSPLNSKGPPPRPLLIGNGRGNVGKRQGKLHAVMWEVVKRLPVINEVNKDSTGEEDNDERNQTDNETTNDNEEASIGGGGFSVPSPDNFKGCFDSAKKRRFVD